MIRNGYLTLAGVAVLAGTAACGSEMSPTGAGGSAGSPGASGTAGAGTAGTTGSGGTTGTSGTTGTGGSAAVAGTTGGVGTTGGAGATGTGGGDTGGGDTGGVGGMAGSNGGTGGSTAGLGGTGGGAAGSGGGGTGGATPSSGCGKAAPASMRYSIDVDGMMRDYILSVPSNYDPNTPYRLIFGWHPWGGSAQQVAGTGNSGYYGLKGASNNQAILVSPEGLDFQGGGLGWGNTNGRDIAFLRAMLDRFKSEMCIDESRIFSTGFSFGGMMSNAVACSGLARAVAPMAGNATSGCTSGTTRVAYMGFHGDDDTVVSIASGRLSRDTMVQRNGCTTQTMPVTPSWCDGLNANNMPCNCVSYQGCAAGYPVTWCEFNGPHTPAPNSAATLWSFFSQF
jgi:polyhydroxybutyrate depolymerase